MRQDEYFKRACEKIKTYRKKGYMQHTNLICTSKGSAAGKTARGNSGEVWDQELQIPCLMGERQHDPQTVVSGNAGVLWSDFDLVFTGQSFVKAVLRRYSGTCVAWSDCLQSRNSYRILVSRRCTGQE